MRGKQEDRQAIGAEESGKEKDHLNIPFLRPPIHVQYVEFYSNAAAVWGALERHKQFISELDC